MDKLYRVKANGLYMTRGGSFVASAPNAGQWETVDGARDALKAQRARVLAAFVGAEITEATYQQGRGLRDEKVVVTSQDEPEIPFDGPYAEATAEPGGSPASEQEQTNEQNKGAKRPAK